MFPYYKMLENASDFCIYLLRDAFDCNRDLKVLKEMDEDFLKKYQGLFIKLNFLERFIESHDEKFGVPPFCQDTWTMYEMFSYKDELKQERLECGLEEIKFITDSYSLTRKFKEYEVYLNFFIEFYPQDNAFFKKLQKEMEECLSELKKVIQIPPKSRVIKKVIPEGWYMTTNGSLYNPNGIVGYDVKGHKDGNLKNDLDLIREKLKKNEAITMRYFDKQESYIDHLKKIKKAGWVSEMDFQLYANFIYDFNPVLTRELLEEKNMSNQIFDLPEEEFITLLLGRTKKTIIRKFQEREYFLQFVKSNMEIKRSYQPNINTLVIGYFEAVVSIYKAFSKLNESKKKKDNVEKIYSECLKFYKNRYEEVLMRFCGFSKIERSEKKITTARLNGIQLFKAYLDECFDLYIIPPVVYDKYLDDVNVWDMQSYFVQNYFENALKEYKGSGRVLIRDINC